MNPKTISYVLYFGCLVCALCFGMPIASASNVGTVNIGVRYFKESGSNLPNLVEGGNGAGWLDYYQKRSGWRHPSLLVQLVHHQGTSMALAKVFDVPPGNSPFVRYADGQITIKESHPVLVIRAMGGWWKRAKRANYNLKVNVYGPMYAMWGEPVYQPWIKPYEPLARITTHANSEGIPQWDFRQLIPSFPGRGVLRSNYSQRMGPGPLRFVSSVSPLWPYVAYNGYFTQPNGKLVPPIIVNWQRGVVTMFSEIVTVRSQNASYDFYSITPIHVGRVNHPDFESPWVLYDLSGKGKGYPNLVSNSTHYYGRDPYSDGLASYLAGTPGISRSNESIRYSWADHPGNNYFNYSIDVFGFHPYRTKVPIMNGHTWIIAPSYAHYPSWVMSHRWPVTTFVDTNGKGYATSEGIYQWGAAISRYLLGWRTHANLSEFRSLPQSFRGEYRIGYAHQPRLYIDAIDRRPHLLYAQAGMWNLGKGWILRELNDHGGPYLNVWQLWHSTWSKAHRHTIHNKIAELAVADGYAIDSGPAEVELVRLVSPNPSLATLIPPTSHSTWLRYVHTVHSFGRPKNPMELGMWAKSIMGRHFNLPRAHLYDLHIAEHSLQFVIHTEPGLPTKVTSANQFSSLRIPASGGTWVATYSTMTHRWQLVKASSPRLAASVNGQTALTKLYPSHIDVRVSNFGTEPWHGRIVVKAGKSVVGDDTLWVDGRSHQMVSVTWNPRRSGKQMVQIMAGNRLLKDTTVRVMAVDRGSAATLWMINTSRGFDVDVVMVMLLALAVVGGGVVVWRRLT